MRIHRRAAILALTLALAPAAWTQARADEGMWTFDRLPLGKLKAAYGFEPPPGWADHLRMSAVRFSSGGSGSFVSPDGLVMTNHHVGADTLQKVSTEERNLYRDGFLARTRDQEIKAPDLELVVLTGIDDVTAEVNAKVAAGMDDVQAGTLRRQTIAEIEKRATGPNKQKSDVVTLFQGGRYCLYRYKTYTDVRLVFAPEFDIAFFGGDPDNFEYPRYDLDVCFFRVYQDGKPVRPAHYLKWSPAGTKEGELVFVAGHPGRTNRLNTVASLEYLRDTSVPFLLDFLRSKESFLLDYGRRDAEAFRQSKEDLFSVQNSRKARDGGLGGLNDAAFMGRKKKAEVALLESTKGDDAKTLKQAMDKVAVAQKVRKSILSHMNLLEIGRGLDSRLFEIARTLVRLADESPKPNQDRLKEFRDSNRESLELELFSDAPIYRDFETAKLAHSLVYWKKHAPDDPVLNKILNGRSPAEVAEAVVGGTALADVALRKKLAEGGKAAIDASGDPMIALAKLVDEPARYVRKKFEDEVEGVEAAAYAVIARAIFRQQGDAAYPDATFTLRLAFGTVKGYEQDGKSIPPYTTMGGAFDHAKAHGDKPPYQLPRSWFKARDAGTLKLDTPFNFVSTADIIGGNSGSPVVNKAGEVVGLIFDGNIQSLVLDYGFDDKQARAVSVDSRAIVEALRSVYNAGDLLKELTGAGS
ncbi:MAG: S46 family peptidase [Isosphaeraceae bacterium]